MSLQSEIENLLHPIKTAVEAAIVEVKAEAAKEKTIVAADVRAKVAEVKAAVAEATPELEAVAKAAVAAVETAVEAALASHGL